MKIIQPVRGTHDLLPDVRQIHLKLEHKARNIASLYGFEEVATPIFEFTEVFEATLGVSSDVVKKEMYTFETKGGESVTLRPEGTAGIARAFISNGLAQNLPLKFFYAGPMFRHERPQKGRQRQFHQFGVELLGASSSQADIEVIALANQTLSGLMLNCDILLEINSLGDSQSRDAYRQVLKEFLEKNKNSLSKDSKLRLSTNPLRILDSKDEGDQRLISQAPNFHNYLNNDSVSFYENVKKGLSDLGINFVENPRLVRGLDYYCHTAFEFTTKDLGSQGTLLGGGRYDGLINKMGGLSTPGVGWAAGVERLAMLSDIKQDKKNSVSVIPAEDGMIEIAQKIVNNLRGAEIVSDLAFSGNLRKRLKRANKIKSCLAIIVGSDEYKTGGVSLRDLESGEQIFVKYDKLIETVKSKFN